MALYYQTLTGKQINLDELRAGNRMLLKEIYTLYQTGSFADFINLIYGEKILKEIGASDIPGFGYAVNSDLSKKEIYKLIEDLEMRLAIKQGFLRNNPEDSIDFSENKKSLDKLFGLF